MGMEGFKARTQPTSHCRLLSIASGEDDDALDIVADVVPERVHPPELIHKIREKAFQLARRRPWHGPVVGMAGGSDVRPGFELTRIKPVRAMLVQDLDPVPGLPSGGIGGKEARKLGLILLREAIAEDEALLRSGRGKQQQEKAGEKAHGGSSDEPSSKKFSSHPF
jgi:hypothetical protein